jgi:hypothetical protein
MDKRFGLPALTLALRAVPLPEGEGLCSFAGSTAEHCTIARMITSTLLLLLMLSSPLRETKPLIDNNRVTVQETKTTSGQPAPIAGHKNDVVAIDLDGKTAFFVPKGGTHSSPRHAIVVDLKDVSVPPSENKTKYPLAFPRPGVKKVLENNRVLIWDYTWTPGKPTPMHFHDKDVVVVYLADGELKSTTADGKADVNPISFGLTRFNAPNRTHTEEVVKGAARAIIVELK